MTVPMRRVDQVNAAPVREDARDQGRAVERLAVGMRRLPEEPLPARQLEALRRTCGVAQRDDAGREQANALIAARSLAALKRRLQGTRPPRQPGAGSDSEGLRGYPPTCALFVPGRAQAALFTTQIAEKPPPGVRRFVTCP